MVLCILGRQSDSLKLSASVKSLNCQLEDSKSQPPEQVKKLLWQLAAFLSSKTRTSRKCSVSIGTGMDTLKAWERISLMPYRESMSIHIGARSSLPISARGAIMRLRTILHLIGISSTCIASIPCCMTMALLRLPGHPVFLLFNEDHFHANVLISGNHAFFMRTQEFQNLIKYIAQSCHYLLQSFILFIILKYAAFSASIQADCCIMSIIP